MSSLSHLGEPIFSFMGLKIFFIFSFHFRVKFLLVNIPKETICSVASISKIRTPLITYYKQRS